MNREIHQIDEELKAADRGYYSGLPRIISAFSKLKKKRHEHTTMHYINIRKETPTSVSLIFQKKGGRL